jgi:hypothetical protein
MKINGDGVMMIAMMITAVEDVGGDIDGEEDTAIEEEIGEGVMMIVRIMSF